MMDSEHDNDEETERRLQEIESRLARKEEEKKLWIVLILYGLSWFPIWWVCKPLGEFGILIMSIYSVAGFVGIKNWVDP